MQKRGVGGFAVRRSCEGVRLEGLTWTVAGLKTPFSGSDSTCMDGHRVVGPPGAVLLVVIGLLLGLLGAGMIVPASALAGTPMVSSPGTSAADGAVTSTDVRTKRLEKTTRRRSVAESRRVVARVKARSKAVVLQ